MPSPRNNNRDYNTITPYMSVQDAARAIEFYKNVFNAEEIMRLERPDGKIAHAEIKIDESHLMLTESCSQMQAPQALGGTPVFIHLYVDDVDATVKRAVDAGATLISEPSDQFYGDRNGMITDPFGHVWSIATHVEDVSLDEMKNRADYMFAAQK